MHSTNTLAFAELDPQAMSNTVGGAGFAEFVGFLVSYTVNCFVQAVRYDLVVASGRTPILVNGIGVAN
jgi:hypothetical protein